MVFQSYALFPHLSRRREHRLRPARCASVPRPSATRGSTRVADLLGLDDAARAQALAALGRPAAARGARPRDHRRGAGLPDGRAALQPRRAAAPRDAPRDPRAAAAPRHHDGLRDARPDRGDDAWPTGSCCCATGRIEQDGAAGRALRAAGHRLRRALHRHAADEPAAARDGRRAIVEPRRAAPATRPRSRSACGRSGRARRRRRAARSRRSNTSAPTSLIAARIGGAAARGARRRPRRRRAGDAVRLALGRRRRALVRRRHRRRRDRLSSRLHASIDATREETRMKTTFLTAPAGRALARRVAAPAHRAGADRDLVLLPGRRRRPDHQDHRRLRRRLREGEPRHQGQADLRRHLPGDDRQGAHRAQERRAAADVGAALDRHVHADRRGRDRAVRRLRQDAPRTRRGSTASIPAFMENSQTGGKTWGIPFQRSTIVLYWNKELFKEAGPRPEQGRRRTGPRWSTYAQKLTKRDASRQRHAVGRADPVVRLPVLAVPGPHDAERRRS